MSPRPESHSRARAAGALTVAALAGTLHAAFSLYWAAGGTALASSLGSDLVETFRGREWLLAPIGLTKLAAAWVPLVLARAGWPWRRITRAGSWLLALLLIGWGGLNTLVAQLVLAGIIRPSGGFDRDGMIGHAFLWDPLFVVWGVALALGLRAARISRTR